MSNILNVIKFEGLLDHEDSCGRVREIIKTDNISLTTITVRGAGKAHKHLKTDEIYHLMTGRIQVLILDDAHKIIESHVLNKNDTIRIPLNTWHKVKNAKGFSYSHVLVINNPPYSLEDNIPLPKK